MTGPIFLNIREAREYFIEHGEVYTLRKHRSTGTNHARWGGFKKFVDLGRVRIAHVADNPDFETLRRHLPKSGFDSLYSWAKAAGNQRFLYVVTRVPEG